jgi:hypothetical protein
MEKPVKKRVRTLIVLSTVAVLGIVASFGVPMTCGGEAYDAADEGRFVPVKTESSEGLALSANIAALTRFGFDADYEEGNGPMTYLEWHFNQPLKFTSTTDSGRAEELKNGLKIARVAVNDQLIRNYQRTALANTPFDWGPNARFSWDPTTNTAIVENFDFGEGAFYFDIKAYLQGFTADQAPWASAYVYYIPETVFFPRARVNPANGLDVNNDGIISFADVSVLAENFPVPTGSAPYLDTALPNVPADGQLEEMDFIRLQRYLEDHGSRRIADGVSIRGSSQNLTICSITPERLPDGKLKYTIAFSQALPNVGDSQEFYYTYGEALSGLYKYKLSYSDSGALPSPDDLNTPSNWTRINSTETQARGNRQWAVNVATDYVPGLYKRGVSPAFASNTFDPGSVLTTQANSYVPFYFGISSTGNPIVYNKCDSTITVGPLHHVFATRATYTGDFGGQDAADAICRASKNHGGTWKALLSGPTSVKSRIAINGPVYRLDGELLATGATDLWDGTLLRPIRYDDLGYSSTAAGVWTGSTYDGRLDHFRCYDWTDSAPDSDYGRGGSPHSATSTWFQQSKATCDSARALYCIDGQPPVHHVFVTSGTYPSNTGADASCYLEAQAAGLPGSSRTWRAIRSDYQLSARNRIVIKGPIYRIDEKRVAIDQADFWDGSLEQPINLDARQQPVSGLVWTGTSSTGGPDHFRCDDWKIKTADEYGKVGDSQSSGSTWVQKEKATCDQRLRLYCIDGQ